MTALHSQRQELMTDKTFPEARNNDCLTFPEAGNND